MYSIVILLSDGLFELILLITICMCNITLVRYELGAP